MDGFDWTALRDAAPFLLGGLAYTLRLTAVAALGGVAWGIVLAAARLSRRRPLALAAAAYVDAMRAVPLLLVIFWIYLVAPLALQWLTGSDYPPRIGAERSAYATFILFEGAYFCEIVRAGLRGLPRGQLDAALALGLRPAGVMRLVLLPQALRDMLPVLLTQVIVLFQDVSLVALLNVNDFVGAAVKVAQRDGTMVEMYGGVGVVYFLLSWALSSAVSRLGVRLAIRR